MSNINSLVDEVRLATNFQINKKVLYEKIQTDLHMPYNNGLFKISPELLACVFVWPGDVMYLTDIYQNPVEINCKEFAEKAQQHYQMVMNRWHNEYNQLKQIRKI